MKITEHILSLILFLIHYNNLSLIYKDSPFPIVNPSYDYIITDFLSTPLFNFSLSNNSQCPVNLNIFNYSKWEGTITGCLCDNQYFKRYCLINDFYCQFIEKQNEIPIHKWKNISFCISSQNNSEFNYYNLLTNYSVNKHNQCGNQYKQCGILDTLNNTLCLPPNIECPLNYFNKNILSNETYKTINISDNNYIYFANNTNTHHGVISQFKLGENKHCLFPDEYHSFSNPYPLDKHPYYGCEKNKDGIYFDTRYTLIDSDNKLSLYKENNIIESMIKLPYYPMKYLHLNTISLFSKPFTGYDKNCLKAYNISPETVYMKSKKLIKATFYFRIIILIYHFLAIYDLYERIEKGCFRFVHTVVLPMISVVNICVLIWFTICIIINLEQSFVYAFCGDHESQLVIEYGNENIKESLFKMIYFGFFLFVLLIVRGKIPLFESIKRIKKWIVKIKKKKVNQNEHHQLQDEVDIE